MQKGVEEKMRVALTDAANSKQREEELNSELARLKSGNVQLRSQLEDSKASMHSSRSQMSETLEKQVLIST